MVANTRGVLAFIAVSEIVPGNNPRKFFPPEEMKDLENSVAEHGILQPIVVKKLDKGYQLIAGERRLRAAKHVFGDAFSIPAMCVDADNELADQIALIENIQRANMAPTEEAEAAAKILGQQQGDRDETARVLGWSRQKLDKRLALMNCSESVRDALTTRKILIGHAELLAAAAQEKQDVVLKKLLEAPELISVVQFKQGLEAAAKHLADAIFDKAACQSCQYNSGVQKELFAESISDGRCTNGQCFDAKTTSQLAIIQDRLEESFQSVKIIAVGDEKTFTSLVAEGATGVGNAQAESCKSCAKFGAALFNVPGKVGSIRENVCFDLSCNSQKIAAHIKASQPVSAPVSTKTTSDVGMPSPDPVVSTATATTSVTKPAAESQRLVDYRQKIWRAAIKKELIRDADVNRAMLLTVLMAIGGRDIAASKLAGVFGKLTGTTVLAGNIAETATAVKAASTDVVEKMLHGVVLSIIDNIAPMYLPPILNAINVDLTLHWKFNEEYLDLLTKSEIDAVCAETGMKASLGGVYVKAMTGAKKDFIKTLLTIPDFAYDGVVPSNLLY